MIQLQARRYQVILWRDTDRATSDTGLLIEYDLLEEAVAALETHQLAGIYRSGLVLEWFKESGIWNLVAQYP